MFHQLQIYDPRERTIVRLADLTIAPLRWIPGPAARPFERVLILRLERIGDLLMVLDAISYLRRRLPDAHVDLVVGSWNTSLAELIPGLNRVVTLDAPWLARSGSGSSWGELIKTARSWRARRYDLVVNFEPDIRSNFLAWLSGGRQRLGYWTGGGGAFLTQAVAYDPSAHVSVNARRLAAMALNESYIDVAGRSLTAPRLIPPSAAERRAAELVSGFAAPLIGIHVSGGRAIKQWPPERFRELARRLIADRDATIVLSGADEDGELVRSVQSGLPEARVLDVGGKLDLPALAALLARLDLLVTGDTGPMHLAHAVGTPIVAIFGPSDPARYAPAGGANRIVRIDLPCSPCNRIRMPPARCIGHTPDCLAGIPVELVLKSVDDLLREVAQGTPPRTQAFG